MKAVKLNMYTAKDIAVITGYCYHTILAHIKQGKLPARLDMRRRYKRKTYVFFPSEVNRYIDTYVFPLAPRSKELLHNKQKDLSDR